MLLGMALKGHFRAFADQTLATFLATAAQDRATSFGGHTGTEAVLLLTGTLRRTISRAHDK
jgi:hypothetical protein